MTTPRLWIALTRPDHLVAALAIAALSRGRFLSCHLIHEQSEWWHYAGWDEYRGLFAAIHPMTKVKPVRGLLDSNRYVSELRRRQSAIAALGILDDDTIVALASTTNLANGLASAYPKVPKVLCLPVNLYADARRPATTAGFRHTTSGWLQNRWLERRAGVGRTLRLKRRQTGGDGARLERLERELDDVFQSIVVLSNDGGGRPPDAGPRVFDAAFPDLRELDELLQSGSRPTQADGPRRVVFFGTPFLLVRNLDPHQYAAILNDCFAFIRRHYGATRRLIYRPHPAETSERRLLRLRDFVIDQDLEVAELYLMRHARSTEAVFSVASTVSRVAFNYGLNSYVLWRCFPFIEPASTFFAALMGRIPKEFEIRSLDEAPVAYASRLPRDWKKVRFTDGMLAALSAARVEKGIAPVERSPV